MGVPCVTLRGGGHAHNVGVSLLGAVGLAGRGGGEEGGGGWVADTEEQYIEFAVGGGCVRGCGKSGST